MKHFQRSIAPILLLALSACGKLPPATAGLAEPCVRNADCAAPYVCSDGRCIVDAGRACEPGTHRCNGDALETCKEGGDGWASDKACDTGCSAGACRPTVCAPGETRCEGGTVFSCLSTGAGWTFDHACPTACDADKKACAAPACRPFDTRCVAGDATKLETCDERGLAWVASTCVVGTGPARCDAGRCLPRICEPGDAGGRCNGDARETCNASGTAFVPAESCAFGCAQLTGAAPACAPAACTGGALRCGNGAIEKCAPDGRSYAFFQYCIAGCSMATGTATCVPPACQPLARVCDRDTTTGAAIVRACLGDGSGFTPTEVCAEACAMGTCVAADDQCVPGATRCSGVEAQVCNRLTTGATKWTFVERCLGACSGGACDRAGACGCSAGSGTGDCGSATRPAIGLSVLLPGGTAPAADGYSTFLVYTDAITSSGGLVVPDGTMVTFSNDGTDSLLASPDADPITPGLQRPTWRGRARVLLRAPSTAREVNVSASLGGSCGGATSLRFASVASTIAHVAWVADDFATTRFYDRVNTNGAWDAQRGLAYATPAWSLGTGSDGDLTAATTVTRDLYDEGIAKAWPVLGIGRDRVQVDASFVAIGPGDEVLLMNLAATSGPGAAVGNYEFRQVARVEGGVVIFTQPVSGQYGLSDNTDLSNQKIVLQRVPQFNNVTVESGGTVTVRAYANGGTGVLAMRVKGTLKVLGTLTVAERGLPGGTAQNGSTSSSLPRWLLGSGQAKAGGGVLYAAAKAITIKTDAGVAQGTITASSTGGVGGTLWLLSPSLVLGGTGITAQGTASDGRVRLDYGSIDQGGVTRPGPYVGQNGSVFIQSLAAYGEPAVSSGVQPVIRAASLVGVVGGVARTAVGLPAVVTGVRIEVGFDTGAFLSVDATRAQAPAAGARSLRWRARLDAPTDEPVELLGVALKIEAS